MRETDPFNTTKQLWHQSSITLESEGKSVAKNISLLKSNDIITFPGLNQWENPFNFT